MGLAFVPLYIKYLGMEAYGLIGLFVVLQTWLSMLDLGMTPTLNREVARYTAGVHSAKSIRDLVRTFETVCCGIGLLTTVLLFIASNWIAAEWLNTQTLSVEDVAQSVALMGGVASLRFIEGLYRGGLLGFQKHVWLSVVSAVLATLRGLGAVIVLIWIAPTIQAFFIWQVVISLFTVLVLLYGVWRQLPRADRLPVFSVSAFSEAWKFAGGMFLTTILALLLTQIDKILLSRLLSLEVFGNYMFASAVAGVLFQLIGPIAQSYYPRLTELAARGDASAVSATYHQGAQLMSIVLVPAGLVLVFFSEPILFAWTQNRALSMEASPIVRILALGTIFNGWMHIPYMLQLAYGWSSFAARLNVVAVIFIVPTLLLVVPRFGPVGAAWVWFSVNAGYVLFAAHLMHVRLLRGHKAEWYFRDIFLPTAAAGVAIAFAALVEPSFFGVFGEIFWIAATAGIAYVAAILSASRVRKYLLRAVV